MNEPEIACTLGAADLHEQEDRWRALISTAQLSAASTADGVRMRFRASDDVARELEALVATERDCCAWAQWTITRERAALILEVTSTADGATALQTLFGAAANCT